MIRLIKGILKASLLLAVIFALTGVIWMYSVMDLVKCLIIAVFIVLAVWFWVVR